MFVTKIFKLILYIGIFAKVQSFQTKIEILTNNFLENLKVDPKFIVENKLSDNSKQFVDDQINNYVEMITGESSEYSKKKRSLLDKFTKNDKGIYMLNGIKPSATVPVTFSEDILLFMQNFHWFAAALESPNFREKANYLVIFELERQTFIEKSRIPVVNGAKLSAINLENCTILAVAEDDAPKNNFHNKSGIYQFDDSGLVKIQSIDMHYASDIVLWRIHNEIYMSIAQFMSNNSGNIHYEIEIPIYKWLGKHFDLIQTVKSKGARKITPFKVDNGNFLAVANFRDDKANTKIYSDIYKYDYHSEKYDLHQRILTRACVDIQVFNLRRNNWSKDTFLVVANSYEEDTAGEINFETESIIYKFIDDYFIPFQSFKLRAVKQWLAVEYADTGFVLVASTHFDGIKTFQYDGWSFMEIPQKMTNILNGEGIKSMRFINFENTSTLVVSDKNNNGRRANIFQLEFTHKKILDEIYDEMMMWCDHGLQKIEDLSNGDLFGVILGRPERADIENEHLELEKNREIREKINQLNSLLNQIDVNIKSSGEITAEEIVFNNVTFVPTLNATKINNFQLDDFLNNIINVDENLEFDQINLSSINIENFLVPEKINNHDVNTLLHSTSDFSLSFARIRGILTVPEGIGIQGQVNGVSIDGNLLQKTANQNISHILKAQEVKVDKMFAQSLNGQNSTRLQLKNDKPINIDHIKNLTVKNLTVGGYINDVNLPTLDKYSLKKFGDQVITAEYVFETLHGNNVEVLGNISGKKLTDLIPIDGGNFSINQDLIFAKKLFINNLQISETLNGIRVYDGKLDVLFNTQEDREITGKKIFDDIVIYKAITLHGRINSKNLEKMNPVISIDDTIFLEGDKIITGPVLIEDAVNAKDIVTPEGTYSLLKLESKGLRLNAKKVRPHLYFVQQLNADEVFVDTINGKSPENFVIVGTNEPQIVDGAKTFLGDLYLDGTSHALKINNVDVEELENEVLKMEGDQIIAGKHHIKHVIATKISPNGTIFDKNLNVTPEISENVTVLDAFETDTVTIGRMWAEGLVNDLPFDDIVEDTVSKDTLRVIEGHKHFKNITFGNLDVEFGVQIDKIPNKIEELKLEELLSIDNIKIKNIYFGNKCNGLDKQRFGQDLNENGNIVENEQEFDQMIIYGNTYISSKKINDVEVYGMANNTVKVDEPYEFDSAIFESDVVCKTPVKLQGHIENLDFDNIVIPTSFKSIISDKKSFKNDLTIKGPANFESFVNNFNLTKFCRLTMGKMDEKNLTVDGSAFFSKGPKIGKINGFSVKNIRDNAWFSDEDTTVIGAIDFEDTVFRNDVDVGGFVHNVSLNLVYENYFSKTKDQNITATFSFENDFIFENNITVTKIIVDEGNVNGVKLQEFVRTAILNGYDQVFETVAFLENCTVQNLTGKFTVNELDLANDVVRYDKVNMVTGSKTFENLNVDYLKLDKKIKIQNVDVLDWFKNSILKTTTFNITGYKNLKNAFFSKGFQLVGSLNGLRFDKDNIMLKDIPQELTGRKIITANPTNPVLFKGIKLKGLLNDIDVFELISNHAYKNKDNIFKTSFRLHNNLTSHNLVVKKLYKDVNITELISNVTNLGVLNNLVKHFEKLLYMSYKLKESIKGQAHFVDYYKIIQTIPSAHNSKMILCPDGYTKIGTLVFSESAARMELYEWSGQEKKFSKNSTIHFVEQPVYVDQVLMGRYLYAEGNDGFGHFIQMTSLANSIAILTNVTIYTTSFMATTNEPCTLFIYYNKLPRILCVNEKDDQIKMKQVLQAPNARMASSVTIDGTLYLIIITQPIRGEESHVDLWRFNNQTLHFEIHQSIFDAYPKSVATVFYKKSHYLAIASGHVQNAMYSGSVEIRRFDEKRQQFVPWQSLQLDAPIQVEFSILSSDELILYILTDDPTESLLVFRHEGIARFNLFITGSALPRLSYLNQFVGGAGQHLLVAQSSDEIHIIQAIFKGEKVADD